MSDTLPFALVQSLVNTVLSEADSLGIAVAVTVVDTGGHPIYFARMDGVSYMAAEVTRRKAVTAVTFRMPSHALGVIAGSDPAVAADLSKIPDVCMIAGGIPIVVAGKTVGGLGVAGGRSEQDKAIAQKAIATFENKTTVSNSPEQSVAAGG